MSVPNTVSILEGDTFVVSDGRGDIDASPADTHGLFHRDTRYLSRWQLTIDGKRLSALSTDDLQYFSAQFFLVNAEAAVYVDAKLSVIRKRAVGRGFHEELTVLNHSNDPVDLEVRLEAGADFADLFEVKDALEKKGQHYRRAHDGRLVLGYRREKFVRETWIEASNDGEVDEGGISFQVHLEPHTEWSTELDVITAVENDRIIHEHTKYRSAEAEAKPEMEESLAEWLDSAPEIATSADNLRRTYQRSLVDLAALRFFSPLASDGALPAAGLPWFMAAFGRDSLFTSFQALPFFPELAHTTLTVLGLRQGTHVDDFRDEEPGRILHEVRHGEMTAFEERPHSPYYGASDATPLFLVLLDEYTRWTGDESVAKRLYEQVHAALDWIDEWGDRDGDGYIEYDRRNTDTGLENQCWKDSWDSIAFADGRLAERPIATCEIQGYAYDAKVRTARLAREVYDDPKLAERLTREAVQLKHNFNRDFWLADRQCFALALDKFKNPVDSLTSNIGHLLWSGIVDDDKADAIAQHLVGDKLFSGWGVRTMAEGEGSYNPIGYHVGTVWPHDCSIIAEGLRRYGYRKEASLIATGILEAADFFGHRLPEAFAGYPRERTGFPVEYPTACSPQAWATGAPLLLLRTLLGMDEVDGRLMVEPALPNALRHLGLLDVPGRWGSADAFGRGRLELDGE